MTRVLVVDPTAEWIADRLRASFPELPIDAARGFADAEPWLAGTEILLCGGPVVTEHGLTPAVVSRMPRLEWIQGLISGSDYFERAVRGNRPVLVTTARGIFGPQLAEMALLHMLALNRQVPRLVRNLDARRWERVEQRVLDGKTVGIVGLGSIGERLAALLHGFGMTVVGVSRADRPVAGVARIVDRSQLVQVAAEADFLVILAPYSAETDRLVSAEVLAAMRPSAFLVNLARGRVVDEAALIDALESGSIGGAGLDVFEQEPLPAESRLWGLDNVFLTPHIAGSSDRYLEALLPLVELNLRTYLAGDRGALTNVVS